MSVNSSDLIFDLSCLQGQIADVGISLQGLETQRLLNKELYQDNSSSSDIKDAKKYIHDLTSFLKLIGSNDNTQKLNQGLSTFYISEFLYNAMLTLNKFGTLEPGLHKERNHHNDKLLHHDYRAAPAHHNQRKHAGSNEDPVQPKIIKQVNK